MLLGRGEPESITPESPGGGKRLLSPVPRMGSASRSLGQLRGNGDPKIEERWG